MRPAKLLRVGSGSGGVGLGATFQTSEMSSTDHDLDIFKADRSVSDRAGPV